MLVRLPGPIFWAYINPYFTLLECAFLVCTKSYLSLKLRFSWQLLVWEKEKLIKILDPNVRVESLCGDTNFISTNCPLQSIVSHRFYCRPTVTIKCHLWDCCDRFVSGIRTYILLFLYPFFYTKKVFVLETKLFQNILVLYKTDFVKTYFKEGDSKETTLICKRFVSSMKRV